MLSNTFCVDLVVKHQPGVLMFGLNYLSSLSYCPLQIYQPRMGTKISSNDT